MIRRRLRPFLAALLATSLVALSPGPACYNALAASFKSRPTPSAIPSAGPSVLGTPTGPAELGALAPLPVAGEFAPLAETAAAPPAAAGEVSAALAVSPVA